MSKFTSFLMVLMAFVLPALPSHAQNAVPTAPDALVRSTVEDLLGVLSQGRDRRTLQTVVEQKVLPHFDFRAMTRLAVGRFWGEAASAQQKALEQAFRTLLVRTYTAAPSEAANAERKVEVKPAALKPGDDYTTVRTLVREPGRRPLSIDYRMTLTDKAWKVIDIVAENASLVISYRGSFASEISRSGIDGLIRVLEDRNRQGAVV